MRVAISYNSPQPPCYCTCRSTDQSNTPKVLKNATSCLRHLKTPKMLDAELAAEAHLTYGERFTQG